jgi:hypothetical protein
MNSKTCLQERAENKEENNICKFCEKNFSSHNNMLNHYTVCSKLNQLILSEKTIKKQAENEYKVKIKIMENNYSNLQEKYNELKLKFEKYEEKALQSTTIVNTTNHYNNSTNNTNNSKNYIQNLIPLTDQYIKDQSKKLELKHVRGKADSLAYFANEYSFKDRVVCTDVARRSFVFKDENGVVVKDPKGVKITKKFIENNKEILVRLFSQYALMYYEDNCPYEYKDKVEIDECLYAVQRGDIPSNAENYTKFEKIFTSCFSKLVYSKDAKSDEAEEVSIEADNSKNFERQQFNFDVYSEEDMERFINPFERS